LAHEFRAAVRRELAAALEKAIAESRKKLILCLDRKDI
jgi:hypothetical protein